MAKEYIFKQDFWGNWKLMPKDEEPGSPGLVIFLLILLLLLLTAAVLIAPFWTALLGFAMNKKKRYWAGIFSVLSFSYFLVDISKKWLSGIWFFGWGNDSLFENGILDEEHLFYVYIINGLGLLIGLIFTINALVSNKSARRKTYTTILFTSIILSGVFWKINVNKIEREKWDIACRSNSHNSYTDYLDEYPKGKFESEAKECISWLEAINSNRVDKIRGFIFNNPESKFSERAKKWEENYEKDSVAWAKAHSIHTVEVYNNYLGNFPDGRYRKQADLELETINGFKGAKGSFKDSRNGKSYRWVKIGEQIWMAENISIETNQGSIIHPTYGGFYDWKTAQKVCPAGWHLPTKDEFETLIKNAGDDRQDIVNNLTYDGKTKFNARVYRFYYFFDKGIITKESFDNFAGSKTFFWSSSANSNDEAEALCVANGGAYLPRVKIESFNKNNYAFPVRYVKDKIESNEHISDAEYNTDARDVISERTILNEPSNSNKNIEAGNIEDNENLITNQTKKNQRDPRAKDVANVFWDSKYTLFCKLTDERIFPNSKGEYDIWYASHEEPYPHHKILTKKELSALLFYKFKDFETCKKWCDAKKSN